MGLKIEGRIERVDGKELTYKEFAERYLRRNQPVLLTGLMDGWRACEDWVDDAGRPNLAFFSAHLGASKVQVADCSRRELTDQKRTEMSIMDFIGYWNGLSVGDCGSNLSHSMDSQPLLYLKDWHFVKLILRNTQDMWHTQLLLFLLMIGSTSTLTATACT